MLIESDHTSRTEIGASPPPGTADGDHTSTGATGRLPRVWFCSPAPSSTFAIDFTRSAFDDLASAICSARIEGLHLL